MSIKLMSLVWQDHTGELIGSEKSVLLRMADFAADNGTQIFPSIKRIALDTGLSEKTVKRAIHGLVEKKRIRKTIRTSKEVHITNLYRINVDVLEKAAVPVDKYKPKQKIVDKFYKKSKIVDKSVKKACKTDGGRVTMTPGVGSPCPGGGVMVTPDPPINRQRDPSIGGFDFSDYSFNPVDDVIERVTLGGTMEQLRALLTG